MAKLTLLQKVIMGTFDETPEPIHWSEIANMKAPYGGRMGDHVALRELDRLVNKKMLVRCARGHWRKAD